MRVRVLLIEIRLGQYSPQLHGRRDPRNQPLNEMSLHWPLKDEYKNFPATGNHAKADHNPTPVAANGNMALTAL